MPPKQISLYININTQVSCSFSACFYPHFILQGDFDLVWSTDLVNITLMLNLYVNFEFLGDPVVARDIYTNTILTKYVLDLF